MHYPSSFCDASEPFVQAPIREVKDEVRRKAVTRLKFENKDKDSEITDPGSKFYQDEEGYAMDKYNYYECHQCKKPYFGGERACGAAAGDGFDPEELICPGCAAVSSHPQLLFRLAKLI